MLPPSRQPAGGACQGFTEDSGDRHDGAGGGRCHRHRVLVVFGKRSRAGVLRKSFASAHKPPGPVNSRATRSPGPQRPNRRAVSVFVMALMRAISASAWCRRPRPPGIAHARQRHLAQLASTACSITTAHAIIRVSAHSVDSVEGDVLLGLALANLTAELEHRRGGAHEAMVAIEPEHGVRREVVSVRKLLVSMDLAPNGERVHAQRARDHDMPALDLLPKCQFSIRRHTTRRIEREVCGERRSGQKPKVGACKREAAPITRRKVLSSKKGLRPI